MATRPTGAGQTKWVYETITKGDLPDLAKQYINNKTPFPVSVTNSILGNFVKHLYSSVLSIVGIALGAYDLQNDANATKVLNFQNSLYGKSDYTRIKIGTKFTSYRKGSQGWFWLKSGEISLALA